MRRKFTALAILAGLCTALLAGCRASPYYGGPNEARFYVPAEIRH